ncbi:diguanylate cyclase [Cohnella sp. AR92]|uniref:GGDEF domain-containing protein n=1 Tax=Cohnella sp. AR92 TaxID=648716 RepID=UPI0013155CE1|nr:GGDEF domain-containing protein [Cohnella sp. AR92]
MMAFPHVEQDQNQLNRYVLSVLGSVMLLSLAIEIYILIFYIEDSVSFLIQEVLKPTALLSAVLFVAALAVYKLQKNQEFILLSSATLMIDILIVSHTPVPFLLISLHLPVLLSLIYYHLPKLLYAILNSAVSLVVLLIFNSDIRQHIRSDTLLGILITLLIFNIVAIAVLRRARALYDYYIDDKNREGSRLLENYLEDLRSKTDPLTGACNHTAFHLHLEQMVRQSDSGLMPLYLAFIDIDNFSGINECYGHRQGDEVLRSISNILASRLGPHDTAARYEGDKFAIQFLRPSSQEAFDSMENLRKRIEKLRLPGMDEGKVTISIGLIPYAAGLGKTELIGNADRALAEAKSKGKNRTAISSSLHAMDV